MSFLFSIWQRKAILLGLLIHFVAGWMIASSFLHGWIEPFYILITPVCFSLLCIDVWDSVVGGGIIAFIAMLILIIFSLRKRKGWIVILAHLSVLIYWCYSIFVWIYLMGLAG
jgi:hypothetical protein